MDLSALQQHSRSEHLHARHEKADKLYRLGSEYLKRASEDNPNVPDRALLRNAARCFTASIEHNRKDPRPYLQQAYLFLLTGNSRKAIRYIQEAQRLQPDSPRARQLLDHAQKQASRGQKKAAAVIRQAAPPNPALMGQRRQAFIEEVSEVVERAFRELQTLQPTWAKPVLEGYRKLQDEYSSTYNRLCKRLDQLEQHLDVQDLDRELQKLEVSLNRLDDICELSGQMVALFQRIEHLRKLLEKQLSDCRQNEAAKSGVQPTLDRYQPVCDELADELDTLEGSGFDISALMPGYEALIICFQQLDQLIH
jgi:tetratricopeptide (TPR) repeat protein